MTRQLRIGMIGAGFIGRAHVYGYTDHADGLSRCLGPSGAGADRRGDAGAGGGKRPSASAFAAIQPTGGRWSPTRISTSSISACPAICIARSRWRRSPPARPSIAKSRSASMAAQASEIAEAAQARRRQEPRGLHLSAQSADRLCAQADRRRRHRPPAAYPRAPITRITFPIRPIPSSGAAIRPSPARPARWAISAAMSSASPRRCAARSPRSARMTHAS